MFEKQDNVESASILFLQYIYAFGCYLQCIQAIDFISMFVPESNPNTPLY